jgi:hypothetical protein
MLPCPDMSPDLICRMDFGDALEFYLEWEAPDVIISDGPYGLGIYPGEMRTPTTLANFYRPHAEAWARAAKPSTTLWFWNSELGWEYQEAVIWDKGIGHIAGKVNSKTIRGVPVVTEIAVRYTRKVTLRDHEGSELPIKDWLRSEWLRSGRPFSESNKACGVKSAATRKYLTSDHMWYLPPSEALVAMAQWCQAHGSPTERPYFSLDGENPPSLPDWDAMRAKWNHIHGVTNVWSCPPVSGAERLRLGSGSKVAHANQKPLSLVRRQIELSSDPGDMIWEPFGGLMTGMVAAVETGRRGCAAEINEAFFERARDRVRGAASR